MNKNSRDPRKSCPGNVESIARRDFVKGVGILGAGAASPLLASAMPASAAPIARRTGSSSELIASDADTVVEIDSGKIRGFKRRGIYTFRGIPYGESTSGDNRFMAPKAVQPWTGIRDTLQFGRACVQPGSDAAHYARSWCSCMAGDLRAASTTTSAPMTGTISRVTMWWW
jgi:hypothetical protein